MAVLEAFMYDPLINWRLLDTKKRVVGSSTSNANPAPLSLDSPHELTLERKNSQVPPQPLLAGHRSTSQQTTQARTMSNGTASTDTDGEVSVDDGDLDEDVLAADEDNSPDPTVERAHRRNFHEEDEKALNEIPREHFNEKAMQVIARVESKLKGTDFTDDRGNVEMLEVPKQVQRLILEATSHINLCQAYIGWCPFW